MIPSIHTTTRAFRQVVAIPKSNHYIVQRPLVRPRSLVVGAAGASSSFPSRVRLFSSSSSFSNENRSNSHKRVQQQQQQQQQWRMGDAVRISGKNGELMDGTIEEIRGSGWFTVRLVGSQTLQKVRTSQLSLSDSHGHDPRQLDDDKSLQLHSKSTDTDTGAAKPTTDPSMNSNSTFNIHDLPLEEAVQAKPSMTVTVDSPNPYPINTTGQGDISPPPPPPPRMDNLDALLKEMASTSTTNNKTINSNENDFRNQLQYFSTISKWVVFTDLHCAPSTLNTTLQVLQRVHDCAVEWEAGILFLGDFWHHRGTLRVDCLNAVLAELKHWKVPMIMIPGNHDQVTLGGHSHSLTPLEQAYRVPMVNATKSKTDEDTAVASVPGPLVFSHPTLFHGALFVPHIRDLAILESVLQSEMAQREANAIFVHADVTGAYMNDLIVSTGGVHPSVFPHHKPIYSGHFHKPHTVTYGTKQPKPQVAIEYFGSPYETSLAEAQQEKALVVLDATHDWKCVERIPLDIGRKHCKPQSLEALLAISLADVQPFSGESRRSNTICVGQGDRIVATLSRSEMATIEDNTEIAAQVMKLRKGGVTVELRESNAANDNAVAMASEDARALEDLIPSSTWKQFWREQVERGVIEENEARVLQDVGLLLLEELEEERAYNDDASIQNTLLPTPTNLELDSVTVEGYGPFARRAHYPLSGRGLVLLRGSNLDGGSDSNGSGKTSLAMAALWALTGSADPRPFQDNKVSDVVNDNMQNAKVSVSGRLNGSPFIITRTKSPKKSGLAFFLDNKDLTTQSAKETMAVIDEKLGVGAPILARTMFHGQHAINDLLEATDGKMKEELSLVTPLELWQSAAKLSRSKAREAAQQESELQGKILIRTEDMTKLKNRCDSSAVDLAAKEKALVAKENEIDHKSKDAAVESASQSQNKVALEEVQSVQSKVQELRAHLNELNKNRTELVEKISFDLDQSIELSKRATEAYQQAQLKFQFAVHQLEALEKKRQDLESTWAVDLSAGAIPEGFTIPETCPTCSQPVTAITSGGDGHTHSVPSLQVKAEREIAELLVGLENALKMRIQCEKEVDHLDRVCQSSDQAVASIQEQLKMSTAESNEAIAASQTELCQYEELATEISERYSINYEVQQQAELERSIIFTQLAAEREAFRVAREAHQELVAERDAIEAALRDLNTNVCQCRAAFKQMSSLSEAFGNRGIQTFVLQNAVKDLELITQGYLDDFSDGTQRLQLELDSGDRISRRSLVREPDGSFRDRPLATLSGGQWRRTSLALTLGFADLVAKRGRLRPSMMVLDEPLTFLDRTGRSDVGKALRKILDRNRNAIASGNFSGDDGPNSSQHSSVSTIIVILQDLAAEELEEAFDHIDEVVKDEGSSSVLVDETEN